MKFLYQPSMASKSLRIVAIIFVGRHVVDLIQAAKNTANRAKNNAAQIFMVLRIISYSSFNYQDVVSADLVESSETLFFFSLRSL